MSRFKYLLLVIFLLIFFAPRTFAQSAEQSARAAQWDSYSVPDGAFTRFVDKKNGYSFWRPADWDESTSNGQHLFVQKKDRISILTITDDIPDGYGIASYTSSFLQQIRKQPVKQENVIVRHVMIGGTDGREIMLTLETGNDQSVRETVWIAAVGPRAYVFIMAAKQDLLEQYEPIFKRAMMSVHIGSAGHWTEEFEELKAKFPKPSESPAKPDMQAARLADSIRAGSSTGVAISEQIAQLAVKAPEAVLDLLTDYDPNVRTATITGLSKVTSSEMKSAVDGMLLWALTDKDNYCSQTAARALASRGTDALSALRNKLPSMVTQHSAFLNGASVLSEDDLRSLDDELLKSDDKGASLAGLELASTFALKGTNFPYSKLLTNKDTGVVTAAIEAARIRHDVTAVDELMKLVGTDSEMLAIRALGEIAPAGVVSRLQKRMKEIDADFTKEFVAPVKTGDKNKAENPPPPPPPPPMAPKSGSNNAPAGIPGPELQAKLDRNEKPAAVRGELVIAIAKIEFRDHLANAKNEADKKKIIDKALTDTDLKSWVASYAFSAEPTGLPSLTNTSRFQDAPSTGETLLPASTSLYVMSPSIDQTLSKLDSAMSGIQMETVRDQMILVRLLKLAKTGLTTSFNAEASSSTSAAVGIDLKSPVTIASWPNKSDERAASHSAMIVKVTDRARFEKSLSYYMEALGGFESLPIATSAIVRLAGTAPSILPLALATVTSEEARGIVKPKAQKPLSTIVYQQPEQWGEQSVTRLEKVIINSDRTIERETIYLTYLGTTAVIVNSRHALLDLLKTDSAAPTIKTVEAFNKARAESGEIVFYSQLGSILQSITPPGEDGTVDKSVEAFAKFVGAETGSLRITPASWETYFHLAITNKDIGSIIRQFKPSELKIPQEVLPATTILYAGAMIEPAGIFKYLKDSKLSQNNYPLDDPEFEKTVIPHLQGEIGYGLMSFKQSVQNGGLPSMILVLELKDNQLAVLARNKKGSLFSKALPDTEVMGSPVFRFYTIGNFGYAIVTDKQIILGDSVETLKMLDTKDKFSTARDFTKSVNASNDSVVFFSTYSLDSAINESVASLPKDDSTQGILSILNAFTHAFHSQRMSISTGPTGTEGKLAVSFDREGRYSIGELAKQSSEFEVAAAIIPVKGLNIITPTRIESLSLRVASRQPGVIPRIKEDVNKYPWQHVQSSDDSSMVFSSEARHIPKDLTIKLPVTDSALSQYLVSTSRIRSNAPEIKNLAKQIAGDNRDGRTVAHKIGEWTYSNLKWKKVESDTVETLTTKEADCLEHSELYVALARAVGLPARVVTGAAYGEGSFGAHAWVEIYLGTWVEVDPTWGMMDYIDATHIRVDGDSFAGYAMLSQFEMEAVAVHNSVADYQRDPERLIEAYGSKESQATIESAFDLSLTARQIFGSGGLEKLEPKQRAAVINAFDKVVDDRIKSAKYGVNSRILKKEIDKDSASFLIQQPLGMYRILMSHSDGAWYITEIEDMDKAYAQFSDALNAAANGRRSLKQIRDSDADRGLKLIDELIAKTGETAPLLLAKVALLREEEYAARQASGNKKEATPKPTSSAELKSVLLLKEITTRWPDFGPAYYQIGVAFMYSVDMKDNAIEPLRRYAQLAPWDNRPLEHLASIYEDLKKLPEAEALRKQLIERDTDKTSRIGELTAFYLRQDQMSKAGSALTDLFKTAQNADDAFDAVDSNIDDEENIDKDLLTRYEKLLISFPKEMAASKIGLRNLARVQSELDQDEAALKTMQRVLTLKPEAVDYISLAKLHRNLKHYAAGVDATNEALKLDDKSAEALFERACNLARLGKKKEAMESLNKAIEIDSDMLSEIDDDALKSLEDLPEFKALKDKLKAESEETKKPAF